MYKIRVNKLIEVKNLLNEARDAIDNLEKRNKNKITYPQLKKKLEDFSNELISKYNLDEFIDYESRDRKLEKAKKDAAKREGYDFKREIYTGC